MRYFHIIAAIFFAVVSSVSGLFPYKTPPSSRVTRVRAPTVTPTMTPTLTPTPTVIRFTPTPSGSPTVTPTPTIDPTLAASCESSSFPLNEFAGHDCLSNDQNYRWTFSTVNGQPVSESQRDDAMVARGGDSLKNDLLQQCYKTTKDHFEKCNGSIKDQASRLRTELTTRFDGDIQSCLTSSGVSSGDGDKKGIDTRYITKARMRNALSSLYDYCYSHGDSVADYHF